MPPLLELCHSLDPVAFARERLRFVMKFPFSWRSLRPLRDKVFLYV
jgi:hypothetical protein